MTKTLKTIVFFGSGPVAAASLQNIADNFAIEFVITKHRPVHHKEPAPVESLANSLSIPILFADTKLELDTVIANAFCNSNVGVVIDYGVIISQTVINTFSHGIINSHFSILPEWRGADPISFSILSGQSQTGVSLMLIDSGLDTGSIISETHVVISPDDTGATLTTKLIEASNGQISVILPLYLKGTASAIPQDTQNRVVTHSCKLTKADGNLNFSRPASMLEREIRAFSEWPKSRTKIGSVDVIVTKANVINQKYAVGSVHITDEKKLIIGTKIGSLEILELMPAGKQKMTAAAFINGYKDKIIAG